MKRSLLFQVAILLLCSVAVFGQSNSTSTEQKPETPSPSKQKTQNELQYGPIDILSDTMGVDFGPYLQRMLHDVRINWYNRIPESAKAPIMKKGKVSIEFHIMNDGRVQGMTMISSSGDVALDRSACGSITASDPFPPLPSEFGGPYLALSFHFFYNPDKSTLNQAADTPENWNSLAWHLAIQNLRLDEALKYAQRAVASITTSLSGVSLDHITNQDLQNVSALASYWDTLGWVYFQRDDLLTANRYLIAAWQLRHDGVTANHVGQVFEKLGRKDDAVRYYSLALGSANPEMGTRDRPIALAGKDAVSDERLARYRIELAELSILQVPHAAATDGAADFYVAFVPGAMIPDVRFISGNENLKSATDLLRSASYQVSFPDSQPVKLIRRVETACASKEKRCSLKLLSPSVAFRESLGPDSCANSESYPPADNPVSPPHLTRGVGKQPDQPKPHGTKSAPTAE